mmetsp:Transcript_3990/g.13368  ORF Transcript_3990/g.13368 Transcript_3990/m.13368 type:complete len:256 (+) Transcript_3990:93-860(+)
MRADTGQEARERQGGAARAEAGSFRARASSAAAAWCAPLAGHSPVRRLQPAAAMASSRRTNWACRGCLARITGTRAGSTPRRSRSRGHCSAACAVPIGYTPSACAASGSLTRASALGCVATRPHWPEARCVGKVLRASYTSPGVCGRFRDGSTKPQSTAMTKDSERHPRAARRAAGACGQNSQLRRAPRRWRAAQAAWRASEEDMRGAGGASVVLCASACTTAGDSLRPRWCTGVRLRTSGGSWGAGHRGAERLT